jgi:hypothetical protein
MKKMLKGAAVLAVVAALSAAPAQAQVNVGIGGTGLFSLESGGGSDFGAMAKFGFGGASGLGFRADVSAIFDDAEGTGILVGLGPTYNFATSETSMFKPYLAAEAVVLTSTEGLTDNLGDKLGVSAGAGFNYQLSSVNLFAEALFTYLFDAEAKALRANVGVSFPLGGN